MALVEALNVVGQTLILSIGLQFIGYAKFKARIAEEQWHAGDGPRNAELLESFHEGTMEIEDALRGAVAGLRDAIDQVRRQIR